MQLDESSATELLAAIHQGDIAALTRLLADTPALASATLVRCDYRYPVIGAATDWPGNFPHVAETIAVLVAAGAEVNAHAAGPHRETALHGAASCDDVAAIDALVTAGADLEAAGAVIAGGTALDDAVAFAQWRAARRLVEHGARTAVWHASALGLVDRVTAWLAAPLAAPHPWGAGSERRDIDVALWTAAHGGQLALVQLLVEHGADPTWRSSWDQLSIVEAAQRANAADVVAWLQPRQPA